LTDYTSPNQGQDGTQIGDLPPDPDLLRYRGEAMRNDEVHKMIAWTTRKNYPIWVGMSQFKAEQIGWLLDVKVPPVKQCQITQRKGGGAIIAYDGEIVPLGLKIVKEHLMVWNIEGRILESPIITTWWFPYDHQAIMRYGHSVNTDIPEDANEAEFRPEPWPERVVIRIKSQAPPQNPAAPLPAGDGSQDPSLAPGSPSGWKGPALGQAPPISTDASALVGYHSPMVAQCLETFGIDFSLRMRYLHNTLKIWLAPNSMIQDGRRTGLKRQVDFL
jgi:hypothetical protein